MVERTSLKPKKIDCPLIPIILIEIILNLIIDNLSFSQQFPFSFFFVWFVVKIIEQEKINFFLFFSFLCSMVAWYRLFL